MRRILFLYGSLILRNERERSEQEKKDLSKEFDGAIEENLGMLFLVCKKEIY
jgi:hypothetical protein